MDPIDYVEYERKYRDATLSEVLNFHRFQIDEDLLSRHVENYEDLSANSQPYCFYCNKQFHKCGYFMHLCSKKHCVNRINEFVKMEIAARERAEDENEAKQ